MKKQTNINTGIAGIISGLLLILFDQFTKNLAVKGLKGQPDIPIIKGIFELSYVENRGAAFGMLQNKQWFFMAMTILVLAVILWIYHNLPLSRRYLPLRAVLVVLTSGAIGNFIDRVTHNYVVDFFYFKWIDFPVFNVADIYVVVSIFCVAALVLFYYKEDELDEIMKVRKQ